MNTNKLYQCLHSALATLPFAILCACSASNCPLESTVTCNYGFYDSQGTAITYNDTISVSTLLAGHKTQYIYRKLGSPTLTYDHPDSSLILDGYTQTQREVRCDTVLANKLINAQRMSLPMAYFSTSDTLVINYASLTNNDTIYVGHFGYSNVELPECGAHRFHQLQSVSSTSYGIDHIEIVQPTVDYEGKENIRIFFNGTVDETSN